jgi:DNA-binding NarL/FixJ family response regulator
VAAPRNAACVVFVSDPDVAGETDEGLLRRLYTLTRAESKVAALLVRGNDVKAVSEQLEVSLNTTRTHVKRVLRKTNTRRQAELVAVVLSDPTSSRLR